MWLRPLPITRLANCGPAVAAAVVLGVPAWQVGGPAGVAAIAVVMLGCLVLCVRAFGMGVYLEGARATIHGQFRTVTIGRDQIVRVSDFPVVYWRDARGRKRRTPVIALMSNHRMLLPFRTRAESGTTRLRKWAGKR